jgi:predicted nucleic-acid-binding Zn-ribbon protein
VRVAGVSVRADAGGGAPGWIGRVNFIFYGLLFVGFGVWRALRDRRERNCGHVHRCPKCGERWHHKNPLGGTCGDGWPTYRAALEAHTCPKCGAEQFEIDSVGALPAPVVRPPPAPTPAAPPEKKPA